MKANTEWFKNLKWGISVHYLAFIPGQEKIDLLSVDDWNKRVDNFNIKKLADQLELIGAGYIIVTIGQNSGFYCAPNSTYDDIVGIKPSKCSNRDLIAELYEVLNPKGIKLLVYLPSGAPSADPIAVKKFEWEWGFEGAWPIWNTPRTGKRLKEFQIKWEAVIREWSIRWGNKVSGWWIDGCYFSDEMYKHPDAPNWESFTKALKAGNPDSIVAFNPGENIHVISLTEYEDYTAGEAIYTLPVFSKNNPPGRWIKNGARLHIMTCLSDDWGISNFSGDSSSIKGKPRFSKEIVTGYTKYINEYGGVVTWDVLFTYEGTIQDDFLTYFIGGKKYAKIRKWR